MGFLALLLEVDAFVRCSSSISCSFVCVLLLTLSVYAFTCFILCLAIAPEECNHTVTLCIEFVSYAARFY